MAAPCVLCRYPSWRASPEMPLPLPLAARWPPADGIYREDLVFKDPSLTFQGLKNYKLIFWSLRFHGRLFLKAAHVQVLRIWQPEDRVIK